MSTEQNVLEKLEPLAEPEIRPEFVDSIPRPTQLAKPGRADRLRDLIEERFCFGEFGIALGALGALIISGEMMRPGLAALAVVSVFLAARMLTALFGKRVTSPVGGLLAGMLGTLMAMFLGHLGLFFALGPSVQDLSHPIEWFKVALVFQPVRFVEFLVFGGGLAALVTFLARWRLEEKPWLSGELHSKKGRKGWKGLAFLLGAFVLLSLLATPSREERKTKSTRSYPLANGIEGALLRGDTESVDRLLKFYPDALEWYNYGSKVTDSVGSLETARYVVEHGGDFTGGGGYYHALERAVEVHNDPLMEFLLLHGADPNQGMTLPLVTAVEHKRLYAIQVLLEHGADPVKRDARGSALGVAKQSNSVQLVHALKDAQH